MQVNLTESSQDLVQLVEAALHGEEIVILKDDKPVVKLILIEPAQRRPAKAGSAKGLVWVSDDFDEPLEDFKEYME
ncbi:MAG: DUF2281 domain-containing protein [Goleter apudmare HA4340-LM2]|jgi:antitoxin (DNA-binding transcriptional repressor) of toxin-antitoxin stability system|nr:DUF2281 domain-containing protein [Goleter apudmare HA4340-LM2]